MQVKIISVCCYFCLDKTSFFRQDEKTMNFVLLDSEPDILEQKESIEKKPDSGHKNMNILCGSDRNFPEDFQNEASRYSR